MANTNGNQHRPILERIAHRVMVERGLLPDFSRGAIKELEDIHGPAVAPNRTVRDLRDMLWCSIDNDDSLDLDQLTVAKPLANGMTAVYVAVADVDALVRIKTALDGHARHNTTSVYTAAKVFPMLPERLSTDLTSLNLDSDRLAIVVEMGFTADGVLQSSDVYQATVRNRAKLAYNSVAAWLDGTGEMPSPIGNVAGLDENLRMQDKVAQTLKSRRHSNGALDLQTIEARPVFDGDILIDLEPDTRNRAKEIIEDFMIAANGVVARFLASRKIPSMRRVVRTPNRWDRIAQVAAEHSFPLPPTPDSRALAQFLIAARAADPVGFPDLSLSVIKLMGAGEYVVEMPGDDAIGHFGLAVRDYTHSTAPNRRYPDLITHRLLKAALNSHPSPYDADELEELAQHCTVEEDAAKKVERQVEKSAGAMLLQSKIKDKFEAIVTGASAKGTWVRLLHPPIEGRLVEGYDGVDVGRRVRVQLVYTDVERGYIDFKRIN